MLDILAGTYSLLGFAENNKDYIRLAVEKYKEAQEYSKEPSNSYNYTISRINIGLSYQRLGIVERNASHFRTSLEASRASFAFFIKEESPFEYARLHYDMGDTYLKLAELENRVENCDKARFSLNEALKEITEAKYPRFYGLITGALRTLEALSKDGTEDR